ncbi:hypothetical protein, partial [Methanosphaera sp.]|uniref:hypothetical protein n=1 Tax=Methanosphaera sp. TaxID=2666342 RepID=UPI002E79D296
YYMVKDDKITIKNTDENNMTSTIEIDHLDKTSVKFGFKPENVEYIGKVNIKDLEEEEEEEE